MGTDLKGTNLISIILVFIFKQPYKKINEEQMEQSAVLNSQIIEGFRAVETIKGNANEETELEGIEKEYIKSLRIGVRESMLSNVQGSISSLISTAGNLALTYFGIMQVINNEMTLGGMMAFMTLASYFMDPVSRLVSLQLTIQESNISMKRLSEILDCETEQDIETKGKSTVAKLILKYYEPEEGEITIDDVDINEYTNEFNNG